MELSRKFSKRCYFKSTIVYFLTCCMFFNTSLSVVLAGPEGAQVVNGQVSFQQSGYNTTITASDKSIINYSSFDIARPEIVQFIQPGSSASVLNRILSANPTNINGTLLANGRVFFVNPAGVYIGAGARVNVNQLVASGLNITNSDFINGRYNFAGGNGSVINSGDISAEKVYLIGRQVANSGSISCPAGYVVMASGDRVFLGEPGTDVVLEVDAPSSPESAETIEGSGVLNEGAVDAAGGKIVLAAGDIYSQAISNTGSLSASVEAGEAGQIKLTADGGQVTNTGTIEASGSKGGQVTMEGARVGQFGTVHADGTNSDGGSVNLTASDVVALSSDSLTTANAGANGDGGEVIVYSPDTALFWPDAEIQAKGGSKSGNGGFVEVSGKKHIEIYGLVDASATNGTPGTFFLDPTDVTISNVTANMDNSPNWNPTTPDQNTGTINVSTIVGSLQNGTDVSVDTYDDNSGGGTGRIIVSNAISVDLTTVGGGSVEVPTLTLNAQDDIDINAQIGVSATDNAGDLLNLTLNATNGIDIGASVTDLSGGTFISSGTTFTNAGGTITTSGGNVDLTGHTGTVDIDAAINASGGAGTGSINIGGSSITIADNLTAGAGVTFNAAVTADGAIDQMFDAGTGTLAATSTISKATGDLVLGGDTDIDLDGAVTVSSGSLTVGDPSHIADNVTAVGATFSGAVTADGAGLQTFEAGTGTLAAATITKAAGDLTLGGDTGIDFDGTVDVHGGNLTLEDNTTVTSGQKLKASGNVILANGKTLTGASSLTIEATNGEIQAAGAGSTISVSGSSLTLKQAVDLDLANFTFANQSNTDITLQSYNGSIDDNAADQWNSITATAQSGITLEGSSHITTKALTTTTGNISVHSTAGNLILNGAVNADPVPDDSLGGGVELISDTGKIYTPGGADDTL
ncbi:MAG: beta strand repeat-containing protein, partial [Phycisphaerae bacterium]